MAEFTNHRSEGPYAMSTVRIPKSSCEDIFRVIEPQINAEGIHAWPFDPALPIDVRFHTNDRRQNVRMNRHNYFELIHLHAGTAGLQIQNRLIPLREGDLALVGSTLYHRLECRSTQPFTIAELFFEPELILSEGGGDSAEYLAPFLLQDLTFPHIVPARTGVSGQIFNLMQRIRAELPAPSVRARLAVKTYLKMILILLVNQYSSYTGTVETYERQQRALARLRPLFEHVNACFDEPIQIHRAARICGMSESHFMNFFKRTTGQSFLVYLNRCRIERAQTLLVCTDKAMSEISQETGFCDQSYFGNVFRKLIGVNPAVYRKRFRDNARLLAQPGDYCGEPNTPLENSARAGQ